MKVRTALTVLPLALLLVALAATAAVASHDRLEIPLVGSADHPEADGKSRYQDRGDEQRFRVELEDAQELAGTTVNIFVDGVLAGSAAVDGLGDARLALNSDRGDTVPAVVAGSKVMVKTAGGTLVVSGAF